MNQLATKIEEEEILKHMKLRFYVTVFYDNRNADNAYNNFKWFDTIEDALVMFFNNCKKVYYHRTGDDDFYFAFGTNKKICSINAYDYFDLNEIENQIKEINKVFPFDIQAILDRLKLSDRSYYENTLETLYYGGLESNSETESSNESDSI